jgi:aspartate aminotransferase
MKLSRRAVSLKPSPTLEIAAKAKALKAQGQDVISLSVGEPDWDTYQDIKRAGIEALEKGQTKYAPANGLPELRQAIAETAAAETGLNFSPEQVTVSTGAKFVLFSALQMLLDPGDEVLIPAPYWVSYPTMVELAGGEAVVVPTREEGGFHLHPGDLDKCVSEKAKVLILNSPNNPCGEVLSKEELKGLADFLERHPQIVVLSDDIYNRLVFSGEKIAPHLLQVAPHLKERVVMINGISKSFSMTGWRLGWAVGEVSLIKAMSNYQSQSVSCASPFTQVAATYALKNCFGEVAHSNEILIRRRDLFVEALNEIPSLSVSAPGGAFYLWVNVKAWMGKSFQGKTIHNSRELALVLLESQKLATVPGVESGVEGYLRLSFALDEASIKKACQRFKEFAAQLT